MKRILILSCMLLIMRSPSSVAEGVSKKTVAAKILPAKAVEYVWLDIINEKAASHEEMVLARNTAAKYEVPVDIVLALITVESSWKSLSVSKNSNDTKDYGLMQLNSSNYDEFKWRFNNYKDYDPLNPETNVSIGVQYLKHLYKMFGDWSLVIAAYNCGPTRVRSNRIPASTIQYVAKVVQLAWRLKYARD